MVFSLPSFLAAATSAAMPPPAFTEETVAQLTLAEWPVVDAEAWGRAAPQATAAAATPATTVRAAAGRIVRPPEAPVRSRIDRDHCSPFRESSMSRKTALASKP